MSNKTRKRIWSMSLVMSIAIIGALAAFVVLANNPGSTAAHGGSVTNHCDDLTTHNTPFESFGERQHDENWATDPAHPHTCADGSGNPDAPPRPEPEPDDVTASGWSSSSNGSDDLTIMISNAGALGVDDSIILVLEDDFVVPDDIPTGVVFFRQAGGPSQGARTYASVTVDSEDDGHAGDDAHTIRVYVPDMNPSDDMVAGLAAGDFAIIIPKQAGIKNPGDAKNYPGDNAGFKVGYQILTGSAGYDDEGTTALPNVVVKPKVALDDENNKRGYELTITGSGFNKGSSATAYVLKGQSAAPADCAALIAHDDSESLGSATVGDDYKVTIMTEVTGGSKGDFSAGKTNYICVRDDNSPDRRHSSDTDQFELQHSIAVEPDSVASGEEVTVKLRDYPSGAMATEVVLDGKRTLTPGNAATTSMFMSNSSGTELTFEMPGGVSGTVEIAVVASGASNKDTTITVNPSSLDLSQAEVAPNASVIISGSGFSEMAGTMVAVEEIKMDDEPLVVDDAGTVSCAADISASRECVQVTSSGEFTATVRVWTASGSLKNPALDDGEYTIKVKDSRGFEGKAKIMIKSATVTVMPETASPRDFIVISGENWPISTPELDNSVTIEIDGRTRSADVDSTGRFRYEYQLRANIRIGDEHDVTVKFEDGTRDDIEEETTFNVVQADISITPAAAAPGQMVSVEIGGMRPYTLVDKVQLGRVNLLGNQSVTTNREGDATVSDMTVPYLDPGHYPVTVQVGTETRVVQFEMLAEAAVAGVAAELPDAVSELGDHLEAIFHFNNTSKEWMFYDPRPEFTDLNTLTELVDGEAYWILVDHTVEDVLLNNKVRSLTCSGDDCWNLEVW